MTKRCVKKLNWDERNFFLWRKKKLARPRACRWRLSRRWTKALTDPKQDPDLERRFRNVWKTNSRLPQDFRPLPLLDLRSLFRLLTKLFRGFAMFSKLSFIGGNKQWSIKRLHMKSLILFYPHKVAKNSWFSFVVLRIWNAINVWFFKCFYSGWSRRPLGLEPNPEFFFGSAKSRKRSRKSKRKWRRRQPRVHQPLLRRNPERIQFGRTGETKLFYTFVIISVVACFAWQYIRVRVDKLFYFISLYINNGWLF